MRLSIHLVKYLTYWLEHSLTRSVDDSAIRLRKLPHREYKMTPSGLSVLIGFCVFTAPGFADNHWKDLPPLPEMIENLGIRDELGPYGRCGSRSFASEWVLLRGGEEVRKGVISCFDGAIKKLRQDYKYSFENQIYQDDFTSCFDIKLQHYKALCYISTLRSQVEDWERRLGDYEAKFGNWQVGSSINQKTGVTTLYALLKSIPVDGESAKLRVQCVIRSPIDKIRVYLELPPRHEPFLEKISDDFGTIGEKRVFALQGIFHESSPLRHTWYEFEERGIELDLNEQYFFDYLEYRSPFRLTVDESVYEFHSSKAEAAFASVQENCTKLPRAIGHGSINPYPRTKFLEKRH